MARIQVDPIAVTQQQAVSAGRIQMNTTAPQGSAGQIVDALKGFVPALGQLGDIKKKEQEEAADAFFRSKTLDEVGQMIKDGTFPPNASPVFQARVQNLYGSNYLNRVARDTEAKIANGEFVDDEEGTAAEKAERYLTDTRNAFLKGQSKFTVAGFDRQFNEFREKTQGVLATQSIQASIENAVGTETENLVNVLGGVKKADEFGVSFFDPEGIKTVVQEYRKGSDYLKLPPAQRKMVLGNLVQELVMQGDDKAVDALLAETLDNGLTVGTILYGKDRTKLRQVSSMAREQNNRVNREAAEKYHDIYMQQAERGEADLEGLQKARTRFDPWKDFGGILRLNEQVRRKVDDEADKLERRLGFERATAWLSSAADTAVKETMTTLSVVNVPDRQVENENGTLVTLRGSEAVEASIIKLTADKPSEVRADLYARYGLTDNASKRALLQAVNGLNATLASATGEAVPESVMQGMDLFRRHNSTNPAYTQELMGEKSYRDMSIATDLVDRLGFTGPMAAGIINRIRQSGLSGADAEARTMRNDINRKLNEYTDKNIFTNAWRKMFGSEAEKNLSGTGPTPNNMQSIRGQLVEMATAYMLSGSARDVEDAIKQVTENSLATGNIVRGANTLYWKHDLPSNLPPTVTPGDAMTIFRRGLVTTYANAGMQLEEDDIQLTAMGNGRFQVEISKEGVRAAARYTYSKRDIERYIDKRQQRLDREQVEAQLQKNERPIRTRGDRRGNR